MAKKTGNLSGMRVGEIRKKKLKNGRVITLKRISTTGFPQYKIIRME